MARFRNGAGHRRAGRSILREADTTAEGAQVTEVAIRYGAFINTVIQFLIIALSAFFVVKVMNRVICPREKETKRG